MSGRGARRLALGLLLPCSACLPEVKVDPELVARVQVSKSEPGPWCRAVGAVEGASDLTLGGYPSAYDALRAGAVTHGGNYVVIDHVAGPNNYAQETWHETVIGGRLFACPCAPPVAAAPDDANANVGGAVRVPVADPPEQVSDGAITVMRPAPPPPEPRP